MEKNNKKKILHISTYYLPHYGGIEQVAYDIVSILKENCQQKIICFSDKKETTKDFYEGIEVIRVGFWKKISSQAISFKYFFELKKLIKEFEPDFIHFHAPNPLISLYLIINLIFNKKTKVIIHWHSDIIEQKNIYRFYKHIEKILLEKAEKIIVTSPQYLEDSKPLSNFKNKAVVIPNIVDEKKLELETEDIIKINEIKTKYHGKKIIFFIGVHRKYKGIKYLIEAAQYLEDDYIILIAGKGPLTEELKKQAENYKNIEFLGRISDEEKKYYLYASDVFAFPSITKNEAFGVALAEALYCGLPAVTFKIDGSGVNWVNKKDITGVEIESQDPKKYAEGIKQIKKSKKEYSENAKNWVRDNFLEKQIKDKLKKLYECGYKE